MARRHHGRERKERESFFQSPPQNSATFHSHCVLYKYYDGTSTSVISERNCCANEASGGGGWLASSGLVTLPNASSPRWTLALVTYPLMCFPYDGTCGAQILGCSILLLTTCTVLLYIFAIATWSSRRWYGRTSRWYPQWRQRRPRERIGQSKGRGTSKITYSDLQKRPPQSLYCK